MTATLPQNDPAVNTGRITLTSSKDWSLGRIIVLAATGTALYSLFRPWVDNKITAPNSFSEWTFLLIGFFVYPLIRLFRNEPIRKLPALAAGLLALALTVVYALHQKIEMYRESIFVAAEGTYLFAAACIMLCLGVLLYRPSVAYSPWAWLHSLRGGVLRHWRGVGVGLGITGCLLAAGLLIVLRGTSVADAGRPVGEIRCLTGHTDWVYKVVFSLDGKQAVSCAYDETVRVWDVESGVCLHVHELPAVPVHAVSFSPAGIRVLAGIDETEFGLWDLNAQQELLRLKGHDQDVYGAAFSPHGEFALSVSDDATVRFWDLIGGKELRVLKGHKLWTDCVTFSADGRTALSGSRDWTVRYWDLESGVELRRFNLHQRQVNSVAYSPDHRFALSSSMDATVRLWDLEKGEEVRCFKGHTQAVNAAVFTPDGRRVVSCGNDGLIHVWDVLSARQEHRFDGHQGWVYSVAVSPDGRLAISGSEDKTVRLWALPK